MRFVSLLVAGVLASAYTLNRPNQVELALGASSDYELDYDAQTAFANARPSVPFPKWLSDFTGLHSWPGLDPPYIPLDFISFANVPNVPLHVQSDCQAIVGDVCSFDCANCVAPDDVYTCPLLSQTFDDGPTPVTPSLLEKLHQPTTFFTVGVNIVRYPEIYNQAVARGHVMGSHTWSHKFLPSLTNEQIVAQIEWSIWAMNATASHLPKWFRPPYGGTDNRVRAITRQFGMQSVLWDFDTSDWKLSEPDAPTESHIYSELTKFKQTNGGKGLVLEHDKRLKPWRWQPIFPTPFSGPNLRYPSV